MKRKKTLPKNVALSVQFGQRLEWLFRKSGLTIEEFASKIGKSKNSIWLYFRGKAVPPIDKWPEIAMALGVEGPRDLLPPAK